ncbi:exopolysaccharide biosynthesis polyprenyl glycosylphosphotransferase [Ichthyenterobacterium sp. W332]|uniref:Exopolysaccharide biosynthesis polyprenyl glycosylphosphotransferase n=1 Tax=Microcosmobacter mediterraneus TaxID=3075607 RepID=A0ABU2YJZ2_9FLAO|nr:exopolysaccharide biosynthesis polyprenyl glycosylphosphotransferase [Ichthyenterobacterium sp. W332]MDT0557368.1 exopolysaccharide biosynthesis polyprenyl glycosylphosphotransferase [Ichthyenterobacterium sp. W332]
MTSKKGIHFEVSERKLLLRLMDILMVFLGIYVLDLCFDFEYIQFTTEFVIPLFVLAFYLIAFGTVFEIYDLQQASKLDVTFKNIVLTTSLTVLFYLLTPFYTPFLPENRLQIVYFYLVLILAIFLWRLAYLTFIQSPRFFKRVLLIGEVSNIDQIVKTLNVSDPNYKVIGFINSEEEYEDPIKFRGLKEFNKKDLINVIRQEKISEVLISSLNPETITSDVYHNLIALLETGFSIREFTQVYEEITYRVPIQFVGKDFYKYFPFSRSNQNKLYLVSHRFFDIVFSCIGLLFGLLLLPIIIIGNALGNRGPLFYTQERVGRHGKLFSILKLRSMIKNAESDGMQWASKNDSRVTVFGKFLRRSRLDEIPQFINIIKGDMSIIGPRPERHFFVKELSKSIPFYETRHIIKPGLTGWAQVKSRYGGSVDESLIKLQYDLYYIKHRSIFLDLNIIVKTMSTVLYYRGQ